MPWATYLAQDAPTTRRPYRRGGKRGAASPRPFCEGCGMDAQSFTQSGAVAQLGERCVRNAEVGSSILLRSTTKPQRLRLSSL